MSDAFSTSLRDDPLFAQGMAHLQSAEWQEAVRCFEALAARGADPTVTAALEQARFKARLDTQVRVRPVRSTFPWRTVVLRLALVAAVLALALLGYEFVIRRQIAPAIAAVQRERQVAQLAAAGQANLQAWKLDAAAEAFLKAQALDPENTAAAAGLGEVEKRREQQATCEQAEAQFAAGDLAAARASYTDLALQAPNYCNASTRITQINDRLQRDETWAAAEAAYQAGACADAIPLYHRAQALDLSYQATVIPERLYACNMQLGRALAEAKPPAPERIPQALTYFTDALAAKPRDPEAALEQRLAGQFIAGRQAFEAGDYADTVARLSTVYDVRPGYQGAALITPLYDALIRSGDAAMSAPDYAQAWQYYQRACTLEGADRTVCRARLATVAGLLTPTVTPSPTPTITPLPTATPYLPPTSVPSPTPPPPLATLRNQIVFRSDNPDQPGYWVMNPDGSRPRYLGPSNAGNLSEQWAELLRREKLSPDGRYRVYVTEDPGDSAPQLYIQGFEMAYGKLPTWRVTDLGGMAYDPAWAPDGSRIVFVSIEHGSDDIWVVNPDGTNPRNITRNTWEWDKHPSWSPDSRKVVFWSNRDGRKQIYVVDANGQNTAKLRSVAWDEYDPIWVK